ncbi:MAG: carboxymuconolactone decarboxylase family protein [Candidatus Methylomirabilia bacterium]
MARVPYLERDAVPRQIQEIYDSLLREAGVIPNFHKVLAHFPQALTAYQALRTALRASRLDPRLRELAYLKTSQVNGCRY